MAHYAIGDIQGCFDELQNLLRQIAFNPGRDTLWLTGDIVNRGPKSLETLRFVMQHEDCIQTVLGNHDLHLLAVAYGGARLKRSDTLDPILNANDNKIMLDWLRHQPLMLADNGHVLVHAGLWPEWSVEQALDLAEEVEAAISADYCHSFFTQMYGNKPARFHPELRGMDRLRFTTNVMTRMRALTWHGDMDFDFKSTLADMPADLQPWFSAEPRDWADHTVVCGHWSALGLYRDHNIIGLDTGALWGGSLTAINLDTGAISQTPALAGLSPTVS